MVTKTQDSMHTCDIMLECASGRASDRGVDSNQCQIKPSGSKTHRAEDIYSVLPLVVVQAVRPVLHTLLVNRHAPAKAQEHCSEGEELHQSGAVEAHEQTHGRQGGGNVRVVSGFGIALVCWAGFRLPMWACPGQALAFAALGLPPLKPCSVPTAQGYKQP